jgi:RNA polymerase sigma-70 factor (ECF subfamily)
VGDGRAGEAAAFSGLREVMAMKDNQAASDQQRSDEFLKWYAPCERGLYGYIVTLIGDPVDAQDILQDTALALWEKFDQFDRQRSFFAWAHEFARLKTLRYRQIHADDALHLEPEALDAVAARFTRAGVARDRLYAAALPDCVKALSEKDRELVRLRYAVGIAVKVLAEQMNRSANAISQSLARVRRLLRTCVEETVRRKSKDEDPTHEDPLE